MQKKKNKLKKAIIIFLIVSIISFIIVLNKGNIAGIRLIAVSQGVVEEIKKQQPKEPEMNIEVEKKYLSFEKKETTNIKVTIDGEDVTDDVEITSSDEAIIVIENGKAKALKKGVATITATKDGISDSTIIRTIIPIKTLKLSCPLSSIKIGEDEKLQVEVTPSEASTETLVYSAVNESIATVDANAMVTGILKGVATFKVYDEYTGKESTTKVTIK